MRFTVKNISIIYKLYMMMVGIFVAMMIIYTITESQPHPAMYIIVTGIFVIPLSVVGIWSKRHTITVKDTTITVQKGLAFKSFTVDVSNIKQVNCVISNLYGKEQFKNCNMKIYTSNGRKFNVASLMINSDKMFDFIYANVSKEKIREVIVNNKFNNHS